MLVGCNTQLGVVHSTHATSMVSIARCFVDGQFIYPFKKFISLTLPNKGMLKPNATWELKRNAIRGLSTRLIVVFHRITRERWSGTGNIPSNGILKRNATL